MGYKDPEKQRKYQREWLARKRETAPSGSLGWQSRRKWLNEQKARPCADCGVEYPYYVMDFDHLQDKTAGINQLVRSAGLERLKAEIAKCEVVCANCHRVRTHQRST